MITTNDEILHRRLQQFRQHGIVASQDSQHPAWYYEMQSLGFNYRLTDIQAALGISQLKKLEGWITQKRTLVKRYEEKLEGIKETTLITSADSNSGSALHLCVIQFPSSEIRDHVFSFLRKNGVGCQVHYIPVYRHPYYQSRFHISSKDFPRAESYFERALSIPLYPALTEEQQDFVVEQMKKAIEMPRIGLKNS